MEEIKELIKKHLPEKEHLTTFDVFKARQAAIKECEDENVKALLLKASYSPKDFKHENKV